MYEASNSNQRNTTKNGSSPALWFFSAILLAAICACAGNVGGGSVSSVRGLPPEHNRYCHHACAEFSPDGTCVRYYEDSNVSCGDFLDGGRVEDSGASNTLVLSLLVSELCRELPRSPPYRIAVSLRGVGNAPQPAPTQASILAGLERELSDRCTPPHRLVPRGALLTALREIEGGGLVQGSLSETQRLRRSAAADVLVVPVWDRRNDSLALSLQAIDVGASPGTVLSTTRNREL